MRTKLLFIAFLLTAGLAAMLPSLPATAAGLCYVKAGATGAANGTSWADAYTTVQDALADANCTEIWVAAGVYYPDEGTGQTNNDRASTFQLKNGVALYGGFAGTETARDQRNPAANVTVLSGDIDGNDTTNPNGVVTDPTNIAGSNAYHVVTGSGTDSTAVLDGFTVTAGQANGSAPDNSGGGMYNDSGSPTLTTVTFSGNSATYSGGMYNTNSSPTLSNVTFSGNSAFTSGGGMYNTNSSPTLSNVTFSGNSAADGGGMYNDNSSPTLSHVTFDANSATNVGGGMTNNQGSPTLSNVTFSNNSAYNGGGMLNASSRSTLTTVTFFNNSATNAGGGMYTFGDDSTLTTVTFSNNSATNVGGGMYNYFSSPTLVNVTFSGNQAGKSTGTVDINGNGGGMYNYFSSPTLTNVTFSYNFTINNDTSTTTFSGGGGMYNTNSSSPTLTNVTFSNNSTGLAGVGGGMYNTSSSSPTLTNVTFSANSATNAGGMYNDSSSPTLSNVTFSANSATNAGGMYSIGGSPTLSNTIIANSTAGGDCVNGTGGSIASGSGYNLIEDTGANACGLSDGVDGNIIGQDPNLGPLTDFGGPGKQIFPLLTGSPAIDAGDPAYSSGGYDQRGAGYPRVENGRIDIGAYEVQCSVTVTSAASSGAGTLRQAIADVCNGGAITFDTGLSGRTIDVSPDGQLTIDKNVTIRGTVPITVSGGGSGRVFQVMDSKNVTFDSLTIANGSVNGSGGGIYVGTGAVITVTHSTLSGNSASTYGGGIYNYYGVATVVNSTLSGNSASTSGGGIFNNYGDVTVTNVTFSANSATSGGGMYNTGSSLTLTNTIIANSTSGGDCVNGAGGSIASGSGYNLIEDTGTNACGLTNGSNNNIIGQDPNLGPLTDFGGPGKQVFPLLSGSPAIDAGANAGCPATDQRGAPRPVDGDGNNTAICDIGAFEFDYNLTLSKQVDDPTPLPGQTITFTIVATNADLAVTNALISDTLPAGLNFVGPITLDDPTGTGTPGSAPPTLASGLSLAPGDVVTVTFPVTVSRGLAAGTPLTNTASVSATEIPTPTFASTVVTVANQPPVADAGSPQTVPPAVTVTLDGSASSDPDGHTPLTYGWTQTGGPAVTLSNPTAVTTTFTVPTVASVLTFTLTVTDSLGLASAPAQVVVTVNVPNKIIFVKHNATGAATGLSWTDAYTNVQDALNVAVTGYQIWVAAGVYYPDEGLAQTNDARASTFQLKNGVSLYGGFAGTETALSQRDLAANVTVLSGDIDHETNPDTVNASGVVTNTANIAGSNAYHVVTGGATDSTAVLDGFTVTAGQANDSYPDDGGGGIYNASGSPTLRDVTFSANSATSGGGMFNYTGAPTLTNITFSANSAGNGGGMFNHAGAPTLTNVTFSGNSASTYGGGMYNHAGSPTLTNTIIANSTSGGDCVNGFSGSVASGSGYNLIEDSTNACGLTNGTNGNIIGVDPNLGALTGSPAYFPLLSGSPAIDAGTNANCPATDQRGAPRPMDGDGNNTAICDIGAFELGYNLTLSKQVDNPAPLPGQTVTFTIVAASTDMTVTNALISDTLPAGLNFVGPISLEPSGAGTPGSAPPTLASGLSLAPGDVVTVTFPVTVSRGLAAGTPLTNTASVSAAQVSTPGQSSVVITVQNSGASSLYLPLVIKE